MNEITKFGSTTMRLSAPLFALTLLAVSATGNAGDITHELGTTTVPDSPERIIVLEFSYIDALASVGVAPVGIADDDDRDRVIDAYTEIIGDDWVSVGTRKTPSLEIMASLSPDLIIADKRRHSDAYETFSEIAPTIVLDSLGGDYHDALAQTRIIGEAIGKADEMEKRIADHQTRMDEMVDQIKGTSDGMSAQFGVTNATGLWLHSPASYNGSLLEMFGFGSSMTPDGDDGTFVETYVPTTLEQLSVVDPQILILGKYADPAFADGWKGETLYESLGAVKADQVFYVTAHNWSRLRGMLAAELTAEDVLAIMSEIE